MTWCNFFGYSAVFAVYLFMALGLVGTVLPVIPGTLLASFPVLVFKLLFPESPLSWNFAIFALCLGAAGQLVDFVLAWLGAKVLGATWRGLLGSFVGVLAGAFIPPPLFWIFFAPLLFAFAFEYLGGMDFKRAGKASLGAFAGSVGASAFKAASVFVMAAGFTKYMFF